jgi:hypothetical protein
MNFEFIRHKIEAMEAQHENSIAVMSGAYFAAQEVHKDKPDFEAFLSFMDGMLSHAKFFKWHESLPQACRTFCHLAMVDPMLVETYIGMKFEDVFAN